MTSINQRSGFRYRFVRLVIILLVKLNFHTTMVRGEENFSARNGEPHIFQTSRLQS